MTAEVAILNRSAVALAADSTVTLNAHEGRRKTYNTVNKLFTLSKFHPVGAMIYGAASLMDVPWESLIKEYRRQLRDKCFGTISECADDVVSFLAALLPFAQRDVVNAFLTGCEHSYEKMIRQMFGTVMENLPRVTLGRIIDVIGELGDKQREAIRAAMDNDISKVKEDFFKTFDGHKNDKHIKPLLDVIAALPKDELASMAEALVNLTSVKRKMSLDEETVGGPIDVAVISKGDGFVWIRRKHYFSSEFNPHFMETYFRR